jgi:hypothetical protein
MVPHQEALAEAVVVQETAMLRAPAGMALTARFVL